MADHITADGVTGPLGVRYSEEEGIWVVLVYLSPVELIGGAHDGEIVAPGFFLDLEGLRSLFDRVNDFTWRGFGFTSDDGPHVSIEGIYQGHEVFLQVQAYAPEDEDPGAKAGTSRLAPRSARRLRLPTPLGTNGHAPARHRSESAARMCECRLGLHRWQSPFPRCRGR